MNYGFAPSVIDGTETIIDDTVLGKSLDLPTEYTYEPYVGSAKNQGNEPKCVPYSLSVVIELKNKLNGINGDMSIDYIFDQRADKKLEGMSIKEALKFMKKYGYVTSKDYENYDMSTLLNKGTKIDFYGRLVSPIFMQKSLIINGPFILGLPVYDSNREDFWNGSNFEGGHAICCIGYNKDGIILRNSWGSTWGNNGCTVFPYADFSKIYEAWAVIS